MAKMVFRVSVKLCASGDIPTRPLQHRHHEAAEMKIVAIVAALPVAQTGPRPDVWPVTCLRNTSNSEKDTNCSAADRPTVASQHSHSFTCRYVRHASG